MLGWLTEAGAMIPLVKSRPAKRGEDGFAEHGFAEHGSA
jgi:hypothetical protein